MFFQTRTGTGAVVAFEKTQKRPIRMLVDPNTKADWTERTIGFDRFIKEKPVLIRLTENF